MYKIILFAFKAQNELAPSYICELITQYAPSRALRSRDQYLLKMPPKTRLKTFGDRSFEVAAPTLWNALPLDMRKITSLEKFKKELKTYLFKLAFE